MDNSSAHVGITRARRRVTLSRCVKRKRGGEAVEAPPSRYLEEIPAELLDPKTADAILTPAESAELKRNFFRNMKVMLGEWGGACLRLPREIGSAAHESAGCPPCVAPSPGGTPPAHLFSSA